MNIQVITVNYGETLPTESLLESLSLCDYKDILVSIADNSATKKSINKLIKIKKNSALNIDIFSNKKNLYYWPAAKKIISTTKNLPDWILICNNDITFNDKNFFKKLEKINPKTNPIIGPDITNKNGDHLNPFMIKPSNLLKNIFWRLYFLSYRTAKIFIGINRIISRVKSILKKDEKQTIQEVYSIHGSAILLSSYFFKSGGWLDDNFDFYGEELTLSEIAKKLSLPITYYPELKIKHHEHENTKKIDNKILFYKARDSYNYVNSKYIKK